MNISNLKKDALDWIWGDKLSDLPIGLYLLKGMIRYVLVISKDILDGQLNMRAMSLVYTSLLSLVPLLAVSFSVLKAFGVHNQIEPFLLEVLKPLGDQGVLITNTIIGFVDKTQVGVLGTVGVAFLFYVVLALMEKIERALNFTWRVNRQRSVAKRIADTMGFLVIGPVLMVAILAALANTTEQALVKEALDVEVIGTAFVVIKSLLPTLMMAVAVTVIYFIIPNTRVKVLPALLGALVAVLAWQAIGWAFATFVVKSGQYVAVYSAFAALMLFMVWMYLTWLILLIGSSIAFYHQYPQYLIENSGQRRINHRLREQTVMSILVLIGRDFYQNNQRNWTVESLSEELQMPLDIIGGLTQGLMDQDLIVETTEPCHLLPAKSFDDVTVYQVLHQYRSKNNASSFDDDLHHPDCVVQLMNDLDAGMQEQFSGHSLKSLCLAAEPSNVG